MANGTKRDILQFSCPIFFAKEGEGVLAIDVMRLGSMKGRVAAHFHTEDASAKSGRHYIAVSGELVLEDGQDLATVEVPIQDDGTWAPTVEFRMRLTDPEDCELGAYLHSCRVKVFTDDAFPCNKFREDLKGGHEAIRSLGGARLFFEFAVFNFGMEEIRWRTILTAVLDQFVNLYFLFTLTAKTYLVNVVFGVDTESSLLVPDRTTCASLIGLGYVLPTIFIQFWEFTKAGLDVEGRTRSFLQASLFRKYLNYSDESRSKVHSTDMQIAILQEASDIAHCYVVVLEMIQAAGRIILLAIFTLLQVPNALPWILTLPAVMFIFGYARRNALSDAKELPMALHKLMIEIVTETCQKYGFIADYAQRPHMTDLFEKRLSQERETRIPEIQIALNNSGLPRRLGQLLVGVYITLYAPAVLNHDLELGSFLAIISVFTDLSEDFSQLYSKVMTINDRVDALFIVTEYLNMKTDVADWKVLNRRRRETTKEQRKLALAQPMPPPETGLLRSDLIPISMTGLSFGYGTSEKLLSNVNLSVAQGKVIALVGTQCSGKNTFLRLLANRMFPDEGQIFIPTHLRILYVSQAAVFIKGNLWQNLTFGAPNLQNSNPSDFAYVREIVSQLAMPQVLGVLDNEVVALQSSLTSARASWRSTSSGGPLKDDYVALGSTSDRSDSEEGSDAGAGCVACLSPEQEIDVDEVGTQAWFEELTYTDKVKICLARAFIMNPEVLVLHRPFHHYDAVSATQVMQSVSKHHKNRGLCMPEDKVHNRRPRSIFYSPENKEQTDFADIVWQIDPRSRSVYEISRHRLTKDFSPP
mmetsp:Transcript_18913/g.33329  ORF Transcript_18913/g.33329 Transcript_18913/m.33329 type:complete len:812 (-) Transcript_18913:326-2761(-)